MTGLKILCGAAALLSSTSALAQTGRWTVSEASGRVVVRDASGDHAAQRGSIVPAGATLMTSPGARAVLVRGEDFVTVAANSRLRVPEAAQTAGLFQMIEEWGNAVFRIKHLAKPHFAVQTPYLAAVVKGTTFSVTVTPQGASLQVIDGAVEVATNDGGAHELVRPGTVAMVSATDRFRLSVQGQSSRAIDSPQRPAGGGASAPTAQKGPDRSSAVAAGADDIAWSDVSSGVIAAPIEAKPVDLGAVTGGMVSGASDGKLAAAVVAPAARKVEVASNDVNPGKNGPSTDPANGGKDPGASDAGSGKPDSGDGKGKDNGKDDPSKAQPNPGKDDPGKVQPNPGKDDPAKTEPKPGKDDPAKADPKPGKDDPAKADPKPGKDDPAKADPKPGKDDPAKADPKPGKDDPAKADPKPGKDDPAKADPKPGNDQGNGKDNGKHNGQDNGNGNGDGKPGKSGKG